jgi:hypothetical protein
LVYLLVLLLPLSCSIFFWGFYFLPFSVHVQTSVKALLFEIWNVQSVCCVLTSVRCTQCHLVGSSVKCYCPVILCGVVYWVSNTERRWCGVILR